jgi:hypothetical protein
MQYSNIKYQEEISKDARCVYFALVSGLNIKDSNFNRIYTLL